MYTWRLKKYAGVDENTGKALYYKRTEQPKLNADGTPVLDEKQNPVTEVVNTTTDDWSAADYYILDGETTIADFMGGFGTSFAAYGFDFSINCSFQIGGKQLDDTYSQFMSSPTTTLGYNYHADLLNSWTPENKTNIPRFCYGDLYSAASSDRFLTDASFLNIDNINVGYTLPKQFTKKFGVNSLRLYVSADNVFYWSKRQGKRFLELPHVINPAKKLAYDKCLQMLDSWAMLKGARIRGTVDYVHFDAHIEMVCPFFEFFEDRTFEYLRFLMSGARNLTFTPTDDGEIKIPVCEGKLEL